MGQRGSERYAADVRWTTHGVAHVRADDWGGLGFGQGWACARDHLPTLLDQITKVRSERALFHGPGPDDAHLASDLGYLALGVVDRAEALRAAQPSEIRDLVAGYAAGCSAWLAEALETDALPGWCAGAGWVRPIDEIDLYAYLGDVALMGSGRNLAGIIGRAQAPGPDGPHPPAPLSALGSAGGAGASNGWALGSDISASGHGIVVANPHFPWGGEARFWECHLTIPGELDVYGVALLGTPGVQIGFNQDVAWTHTFSKGHRFTLNRLDLVSGRPTAYRHGDDERDMEATTHRVDVLVEGEVVPVERTLWRTHHGPMVNLPLLGWGLETAFSYRDANVDETAVLRQFVGMDRARDLDDLQRVFAEVQGLPWVNTLATDRSGRVWYVDASTTPDISAAAQERFRERLATDVVAGLLFENRVALLDGSDPGDDWLDDPAAPRPGVIPHERLPQVERRDYVVNANDSHWLPHPATPLEGYSVLHGFERTPQSLRTRANLRTVQELADAGAVTVTSAVDAMLDNRSLSADLLLDQVVARLRAAGSAPLGETSVDLAPLADLLEGWDRRYDLDSVGAVLWREVMAGFPVADHRDAGTLFAEAFDPDDPVATPRGLAPAPDGGADPVVAATVAAIEHLAVAGLGPDAVLGDVQWAQRGDERVPVHGGGEGEGLLNVIAPIGNLASSTLEPGPDALEQIPGRTDRTGLAAGGYRVTYGTSFVMSVEMTDDGPRGVGLLAYGQSGDPTSPHHADGTRAYAAKELRPLLFTDAEIEADPNLVRRSLQG